MTSPMQDQFNTDFNNLNNAVADYQAAMAAEQQAEENYKNIILKKLDSLKTADQILVYLQLYVFQNALPPGDPHADDSLMGIYGDQVGLQGKGLEVNSYLTAVHNDIQKMVNSTGGDGSSSPEQVVANVASDLNSILDELTGKVGGLSKVMDPSALANMNSTDLALRQQFYVAGDTSGYNPTWVPDPTAPGASYTYHFVVGETDPDQHYLQTFDEMQADMKAPGDSKEATEGYKSLTDNLNSDTGMTQTVNSELNEKINQLTNFIKTLLGFYQNGLLQPSMKLSNVAIQNQTRGS
jgi:hypothetical protein